MRRQNKIMIYCASHVYEKKILPRCTCTLRLLHEQKILRIIRMIFRSHTCSHQKNFFIFDHFRIARNKPVRISFHIFLHRDDRYRQKKYGRLSHDRIFIFRKNFRVSFQSHAVRGLVVVPVFTQDSNVVRALGEEVLLVACRAVEAEEIHVFHGEDDALHLR